MHLSEHRLVARTVAPPSAELLEAVDRGVSPVVTPLALVSEPAAGLPGHLHLLEVSLEEHVVGATAAGLDRLRSHPEVFDVAVVRSHVEFVDTEGPTRGTLRTHFMERVGHLDRLGFLARYDAHPALVLAHWPLFLAYVTNAVVAGDVAWDGMSQQWFVDSATATEHTRATLAEKEAVAADIVGFIGAVQSYEATTPSWMPKLPKNP